ncbi:MAG: hypothetical protein ACUVRX_09335 [Actinomycetota bacterium]
MAAGVREPRFRAYPERTFIPFPRFSISRVIYVGEQLGVDSLNGGGLGICADSAAAAAGSIVEALGSGDFSFRGYASELYRSPFFPLFLVGATYWPQCMWGQSCFLFSMSTTRPPRVEMNVIE